MKLDILAFGAHPDDVELSCGGTLIGHVKKGYKVGVVDLTKGELGTRGTPEVRMEESALAAKIMGLSARENLGFRDGWFGQDEAHQLEIIRMIRKYQPTIVLANATYDRHPDHGRGAKLVEEAFFKSGLRMIKTRDEGEEQEAWRPKRLLHYIQSVSLTPDLFVDISDSQVEKMEAIKAYYSQFYNPKEGGPETYISSKNFLDMMSARAREHGQRINVDFAEGFCLPQPHGVADLHHLL